MERFIDNHYIGIFIKKLSLSSNFIYDYTIWDLSKNRGSAAQ